MEKMKRNKLALALAATLGLGAAATNVQAVNLAENGVGQYSIIPYFSVTKGQNEIINVVNTSSKTVAARIIFRRGTDSTEVRDFIIVLSPKDVWTGVIQPTVGGNAKIVTSDKTCTVPDKLAAGTWAQPAPGVFEVDFDSSLFGGSVSLPSNWVTSAPIGTGSTSVAKIQEGYVTISVIGVSDLKNEPSVGYFAKHVAGTPRNCAVIADTWFNNLPAIVGQFTAPENVLRVSSILVDGASNLASGVPVTSLANVFSILGESAYVPSRAVPDETFTSPSTANVFESNTATLNTASFLVPEQAFSAVLMNDSVYGTYDTTGGTASSWVLTFPTKRSLQLAKSKPFIETCVPLGSLNWDNEESVLGVSTNQVFSPFTPPVTPGKKLCNEVNVVDFLNKNPLQSLLKADSGATFASGWMQIGFPGAAPLVGTSAATTTTFTGMPVIGFEYFENGGFSATNSLGYSKNITRP